MVFLGYVILVKGIYVALQMVEVMVNWERPKNIIKNKEFSWVQIL